MSRPGLAQGGIAGGIGIKVGNMVPACCECYPGGSIADLLFPRSACLPRLYAEEIYGRRIG
jgi:hypothetical protein